MRQHMQPSLHLYWSVRATMYFTAQGCICGRPPHEKKRDPSTLFGPEAECCRKHEQREQVHYSRRITWGKLKMEEQLVRGFIGFCDVTPAVRRRTSSTKGVGGVELLPPR